MSASRQDYEAVASIIAEAIDRDRDYERYIVVNMAYKIACTFKESNPRFDRDRFYRACHLDHLAASSVIEGDGEINWLRGGSE